MVCPGGAPVIQEREAMTSRQPGAMPPGIAGHAEVPGETGGPGHTGPEPEPVAGAGLTAQDWLGPLHQDAVVLGVVLEVVIVTLFVIVLVLHGRGSQEPTAVKLRAVLLLVLGAGAIGAAVLMLAGLNLKGLGSARRLPPIGHPTATPSSSFRPHPGSGSAMHIPVTVLLYTLLVVVLLAAVAVSIWWARRLRTVDDARAAIIACYLAMETTLAERGTARGAAGTPGELLARATGAGLVRGTAAGQLTALFYEARFSSHPLGHQQRDAAERALDELAADLAQTEGAAR